MLYNYLALESLNEWPKEKLTKILSLLNIKSEEELEGIVVDGNYLDTWDSGDETPLYYFKKEGEE